MLDFISVKIATGKNGRFEVYPEFIVMETKDLMVRGHSFYAIWDEEKQLWSRSEQDARRLIDQMVYDVAKKNEELVGTNVKLKLLKDFSTKKWLEFQTYCRNFPDNHHDLDDNVTFHDQRPKKEDYVSRKLPYSMEEGACPFYDELIGTLYEENERRKIEWVIGAIISGDSKWIQKFLVLYGSPGSGKSTILRIIEKLFEGYWIPFDSKGLGMINNGFALEGFRTNPLLAIQHEGDLSRIEDNTKINSIVSHESMVVNEKFKSAYSLEFKTFLILATNKPVKITDAKSGILRRLIDVNPSGKKIPHERYKYLLSQIMFELGKIANHCLKVYETFGSSYYDSYVALSMMSVTNDFYNFMEDNYYFWSSEGGDGINLTTAWARYKEYCADSNIPYPIKKMAFKHELKNYFKEFYERCGQQYNVYKGFLKEKFEYTPLEKVNEEVEEVDSWLKFNKKVSLFDGQFATCKAQYATKEEKPLRKWDRVTTALSEIDTKKLHYVLLPFYIIIIDFDLKGDDGEKDFKKNLEAASKWPPTYAELSKSGKGIHLHYIYNGDPEELSRVFDEGIEIKVFTGNSSLRRKLTLCNDLPIASIGSGLPLKGGTKLLSENQIQSEKHLRSVIKKALRKEIHGHTKPEIDFIQYVLEEAYNSGIKYDVTDLRSRIQAFALSSTNQAEYCMKTVSRMRFRSDEPSENLEAYDEEAPIVIFDVEVFSNLFIIVWKKLGEGNSVVKMINPKPYEVEALTKFRLVGFNNRKYDNHILYARIMGYTEKQLFDLSQRLINDKASAPYFAEAYNLSYTDIYDFLSSGNKTSLKKLEIKLKIHHQEFNHPWEEPVPEDRWEEAADYCVNDVLATEAVWNEYQEDWHTRQMLADLSGLTVNNTTNQCTTKIIVGDAKNPQVSYVYTNLATIFPGYEFNPYGIPKEKYKKGAKIVSGKSLYMGEDPGEGGRVYSKPGIYYDVTVSDVASMHPHSALKLGVFGPFTPRFEELVKARIYIKNGEFDKARQMLDGKLAKYLDDPSQAEKLADALKTAINSVYGLTSAKFDNKLRDPRNVDNIVAKYGALFMMNLEKEVKKRGYTVVHVKTDSIKIANATPEILKFVSDYGKKYGYTFEHESTYKKMCIVNESVYIAQYESDSACQAKYGYIPKNNRKHPKEWTATGTQFQIPYVFKTLFSKEKIEFDDLCETKSVSTSLYLDMNEGFEDPEQHDYHFVGRVGQFCPILPGHGGGVLLRKGDDGKFGAVAGTKKKGSKEVYRWLESETVKTLHLEEFIDKSYYTALVDDAVETISKYGDFESFVSDDSEEWMNIPETDEDELPFA